MAESIRAYHILKSVPEYMKEIVTPITDQLSFKVHLQTHCTTNRAHSCMYATCMYAN